MKFYKGMKQDAARIDQPQDSYRWARNILLDHTTFSVRTEGGLEDLSTGRDGIYDLSTFTTVELCGFIDLPQDQQIAVLWVDGTDNHIVHITGNIYQQIATVSGGPWRPENPIKGVSYEKPNGDYVVAWTDGVSIPVYIIMEDPDTQTTVTVYPLFPEATWPNVVARDSQWAQSGSIATGTYTFFIAYEVDDNNLTPFSPSYGAFKIGVGLEDRQVKAQIKLRFDGLDTQYANYRIYVAHNQNEVVKTYYIAKRSTTESNFTWSGEIINTDISIDQLTVPPGMYSTAETLSVLDDRLYLANVSKLTIDGQSIANNVVLKWSFDSRDRYEGAPQYLDSKALYWAGQYRQIKTDLIDADMPPALPDHYGMSMGFMPGCAYVFYIAFLLKDSTWTPAYRITPNSVNADLETTTIDGDVRWNRVNGTGSEYMGNLGRISNGNGDMLHVMPDPSLIGQAWGAQQTADYVSTVSGNSNSPQAAFDKNRFAMTDIGVVATNVVIPAADQDNIAGYSIFYSKGNANSRNVMAYFQPRDAHFHRVNGDNTQEVVNPSDTHSCYDAYLNDLQPVLGTCRLRAVYKPHTNGLANWHDVSGMTQPVGDVTTFDFEYLPGNTDGIIFSTRHRENKLIVRDTTLDTSGQTTYVQGAETLNTFVLARDTDQSRRLFNSTAYGYDEAYGSKDAYLSTLDSGTYFMIENTQPSNWYTELDNVQLVRCSFLETDLSNTDMAKISWGGDAVAHPNRARNLKHVIGHTQTGPAVADLPEDPTNWSGNFDFTNDYRKPVLGEWDGGEPFDTGTQLQVVVADIRTYMTYSYVLQAFEDMADPTLLLDENIDIYYATWVAYWTGPNRSFTGTQYTGAPEVANGFNHPVHVYKKNDYKSAFTSGRNEEVYYYPNRIVRSAKQNYESDTINWSLFAPLDYYDNALNKGPIQNIESYAGELIIHHTDGIYKTMGKETLDASGFSVFVGSGDIFRAPPVELVPTEEGYGGIRKHTDTKLTKAGYVFVDPYTGSVFRLDSKLSDLSLKGMRRYFREDFAGLTPTGYSPYAGIGYSVGYDPVYDRILVTRHNGSAYQTISFSQMNDCWASFHDYRVYAYSANRAGVTVFSSDLLQSMNPNGAAVNGAFIEPIFNEGGSISKTFQNFNWVTRRYTVGNDETIGQELRTSFDEAIVYNEHGISGVVTLDGNLRFVEEAWNFNNFRNLADTAAANAQSFFNDQGGYIATIDINKPWYRQQRIRGGFAGIRLIVLPTETDVLYLSEASAKFRVSYR